MLNLNAVDTHAHRTHCTAFWLVLFSSVLYIDKHIVWQTVDLHKNSQSIYYVSIRDKYFNCLANGKKIREPVECYCPFVLADVIIPFTAPGCIYNSCSAASNSSNSVKIKCLQSSKSGLTESPRSNKNLLLVYGHGENRTGSSLKPQQYAAAEVM